MTIAPDRTGDAAPVPARGSKISRAESVSPLFEAGKVALPQLNLPWREDFETEILRFPNGQHDDFVDAVVLALTRLRDLIVNTPAAPFGAWLPGTFRRRRYG